MIAFWPVEEIAKLAEKATGCGEVARGGCSFVSTFSEARSAVLTDVERRNRKKGLAKCSDGACPNCL